MTNAPRRTEVDLTGLAWRKSSFSADNGQCVETAALGGRIAVRDSKAPDAGAILVGRTGMASWIGSCKAGNLDT